MNTTSRTAKRTEITIETRSITIIRTRLTATGKEPIPSNLSETALNAFVQQLVNLSPAISEDMAAPTDRTSKE